MTDTAVTPEAPEAENTASPAPEATPEAPKVPVESLGFLEKALLSSAQEQLGKLKVIAEKQAKVGDVGKLLSEAIKSSTDPEVQKLMAVVEKANAAILRATKEAEAKVKPTLSIPSEDELKAMDTEYKTLSSEINALNIVFSNEIQKSHEGVTLFDYLGEIPGKRRGVKAGQGTGMARPRVTSVEYTQDDKGEDGFVKVEKDGKSTFSLLSQAILKETGEVVSAGDFHEEWCKQNGVKDWAENSEVSKFTYSVTDKNGKTHTYWVRVTK